MVEIIPAILTSDKLEAIRMLAAVDGTVNRVQIDIIDGVFAGNKTIRPKDLGKNKYSLGIDYHLMVEDPSSWVEECSRYGADRIIGQIEKMNSQKDFVEAVQNKNLRVGLAVDLDTGVDRLEMQTLEKLDVVLIMSVKAGFGGQKFDTHALRKIEELNSIRMTRKIPFKICVDGGETEDVIDDSFWRGADEVAIGRRLFNGDLAVNIKRMQEAAVK